jgi:hypothetical protein
MDQRVIASAKSRNRMTHESGIETPATGEDMKKYLEITLKEIKSKKEEDTNNIQCRKKCRLLLVKFDSGVTTL